MRCAASAGIDLRCRRLSASRTASGENSRGRSKRAMAASQASSTGFSGSRRRVTRACGVRTGAGVTRDCGDHPVAMPRAAEIGRRHHATHADAAVRRRDKCGAAVHLQRADEGLGGVFEDFLQPAGVAPVAPALHETRTRSPCMTPIICGGGRNTASSWPSTRTKPKPARLALTMPSATRGNAVVRAWSGDLAGRCRSWRAGAGARGPCPCGFSIWVLPSGGGFYAGWRAPPDHSRFVPIDSSA